MTFSKLAIGSSFDFIGENRSFNSFFKRCTKVSARKYTDEDGQTHRVGSTSAEVFHVEEALPWSQEEEFAYIDRTNPNRTKAQS